ncbi:hypothetical protein N9N28_15470 [Rubripirellula amarantea]|nr:hypothetical protein [Rubripirellula amarantea]
MSTDTQSDTKKPMWFGAEDCIALEGLGHVKFHEIFKGFPLLLVKRATNEVYAAGNSKEEIIDIVAKDFDLKTEKMAWKTGSIEGPSPILDALVP